MPPLAFSTEVVWCTWIHGSVHHRLEMLVLPYTSVRWVFPTTLSHVIGFTKFSNSNSFFSSSFCIICHLEPQIFSLINPATSLSSNILYWSSRTFPDSRMTYSPIPSWFLTFGSFIKVCTVSEPFQVMSLIPSSWSCDHVFFWASITLSLMTWTTSKHMS